MTFKEFCKELLEEYKWASFQYDSVISFTQTFSDTTCRLDGQAFTDAQIFIFVDQSNRNATFKECFKLFNLCFYRNVVKDSVDKIINWFKK